MAVAITRKSSVRTTSSPYGGSTNASWATAASPVATRPGPDPASHALRTTAARKRKSCERSLRGSANTVQAKATATARTAAAERVRDFGGYVPESDKARGGGRKLA